MHCAPSPRATVCKNIECNAMIPHACKPPKTTGRQPPGHALAKCLRESETFKNPRRAGMSPIHRRSRPVPRYSYLTSDQPRGRRMRFVAWGKSFPRASRSAGPSPHKAGRRPCRQKRQGRNEKKLHRAADLKTMSPTHTQVPSPDHENRTTIGIPKPELFISSGSQTQRICYNKIRLVPTLPPHHVLSPTQPPT
jgi:hypothetical protein